MVEQADETETLRRGDESERGEQQRAKGGEERGGRGTKRDERDDSVADILDGGKRGSIKAESLKNLEKLMHEKCLLAGSWHYRVTFRTSSGSLVRGL